MTKTLRRLSSFHRSPRQWAIRIVLALLVLGIGGVGVTFSMAQVIARSDPARAYKLAPYDGRIAGLFAAKSFVDNPIFAIDSQPSRLARKALRQDATAVAAVSTLGLQAQGAGKTDEARHLFDFAQELSRRHLTTQLWAIENAVARGDVPGALHQYDIALRTSDKAPDILFPVLASAIQIPDIRDGLIALFRQPSIWKSGFFGYLAGTRADPHAMASLFVGMRQHGESVPPTVETATINGLFESGAVDDAWRFYASVRHDVDRRRSRDQMFAANLTAPSIFDWLPSSEGVLAGSIQQAARGWLFDYTAPAGASGILLQQMQVLPPGRYQLRGHIVDSAQDENASPYWALTCRNGPELGRVPMPNAQQNGGIFTGSFSVPANCLVQNLSLIARPSEIVGNVSGQIDRVTLSPAS